MNIFLRTTAAVVFTSISFGTAASQVQYALPISGLSVSDLAFSGVGTVLSSAAIDGPSALNSSGHNFRKLHLGTNTDLYMDQSNPWQSWVSYTLDTSSNVFSQYQGSGYDLVQTSSNPITGKLWLSFNTNTQAFNIYSDKISAPNYSFDQVASFSPYPNQSTVSSIVGGNSGYPDYIPLAGANASIGLPFVPCIECDYESQLNLSFLELRWNGSRYDLFTNAQGFDQVYLISSSFTNYSDKFAFNIAPVPIPTSVWFFSSGLVTLLANGRRKCNVS